MKLYSYWRSSSAWRVRIAINHKGIDCPLVPVHLLRDGGEQHAAGFRARNPLGQVPVLELQLGVDIGVDTAAARLGAGRGVVHLTQSMAILEYLEDTFPVPSLLPTDGVARARARQLAEMINSGIQPLQNLALQQALRAREVDPAPLVRSFVESGLRAVEAVGQTTTGRFLVGDALSFADLFLIPQLHAARRFAVDVGAFPTLLRVEAACQVLPAFQAAHPDRQADRETTPAS